MKLLECWKPVKDYEDLYEVSCIGNVKRLESVVIVRKPNKITTRTYPEKILKQNLSNGYKIISLSKDGITKNAFVHRLVAEAFIPNPNKYPCVNHKDETRDNNNINNLEWCTTQYNVTYGTCIERRAKTHTGKKHKSFRQTKLWKPVDQYDVDGNFIQSYRSLTEAAEISGVDVRYIHAVCSGRQKQSHGFVFKYGSI